MPTGVQEERRVARTTNMSDDQEGGIHRRGESGGGVTCIGDRREGWHGQSGGWVGNGEDRGVCHWETYLMSSPFG